MAHLLDCGDLPRRLGLGEGLGQLRGHRSIEAVAVRAIRGTVLDLHSTPIVGAPVTVALSVPTATTATQEVIPAPISTQTDASGVYYLSLFASADLTPASTYILTVGSRTHTMTVPSGAYNGARPTYFDVLLDGLITA
jgi:hypothetical protein